jgi:hypothetical protein
VGPARPNRDPPPVAAAACASALGEVEFLGRDTFVVHYLKWGIGLSFAFPRLENV